MKKYILLSVLIIALGIGAFFGIRAQIRTYKYANEFHKLESNIASTNSVDQLYDFAWIEFPDQVKDYTAKLKNGEIKAFK